MTASTNWEARFRARSVSLLAIPTASPGRAIVGYSVDGVPQLHLWQDGVAELRQLTSRPLGFPWGSPIAVAPAGDWLAYFDDEDGNEIGRWVRLRIEDGHAPLAIAPEVGPVASYGLAITPDGSTVAFDVHEGGSTVMQFVTDVSGGSVRTWQIPVEGLSVPGCFIASGALAINEYRTDGTSAVKVLDPASGAEIGGLDEPGVSHTSWRSSPLPDDERLLVSGERSGQRRPFLWNPRTGVRQELDLGLPDGDLRAVDWSPDGRSILLWQARAAVGTLYVHELEHGTTRPLRVNGGSLGALPYDFAMGFVSDDEVLARWEAGDVPPTLLRVPIDGEPTIGLTAEPVPAGRPWRSVDFPSADGTVIQGWLAEPSGTGPFPAVIDIHGGPTFVQSDGFSPLLQAFVDAGFAVLSVNYRGSTTFGREFQDAINGHAGQIEVQDVVAGRDWLVANGIARPDAVVAEGLSYGGYLTLLAIGAYPDRWAAGIAFVAVGDSIAAWEDSTDAIRSLDVMTFGGSPDAHPANWRVGSPMTYAADVRAPVLVFNGRNDVRCPARQMERYERRLRDLGKEIDVQWFSAGHLGGDADAAIDQARRSLAFAARATLPA